MLDNAQLKLYIIRQLGGEVVQVELNPRILDDAIENALLMYNRYKPRTIYGVINNLQASVKKYELPDDPEFTAIIRYEPEPNIPQFQQIEFSILYRSPQTYLYDIQDLAWWQSHLKLVSRIFGFSSSFKFMREKQTDGSTKQFIYASIIPQGVSRMSFMGLSNYKDVADLPAADEIRIRDLSVAYAKRVLGRIRIKHRNVPAPEGIIQLDGPELLQESKEEIDSIEHQLQLENGLAVPTWG